MLLKSPHMLFLLVILTAASCQSGQSGSNTLNHSASSIPTPAQLTSRGQSELRPVHTIMDCDDIQPLCGFYCFAILCLNEPRILQSTYLSDRPNRTTRRTRRSYFTSRRFEDLRGRDPSGNYGSSEEYPLSDTVRRFGPSGPLLLGVPRVVKNLQGIQVRQMYRAWGVTNGTWFKPLFDSPHPYCLAAETSECEIDHGLDEFDLSIPAF